MKWPIISAIWNIVYLWWNRCTIFLQALETGRKATSVNKLYLYRQCMYIVFIMLCENVQINCQIVLKRAETSITAIVLKIIICYIHTRLVPFVLYESSTSRLLLYPPQKKVLRGYIGITLSVRPSMYLVSTTPPKLLIEFLWNFTQL